MALTFLRTSGLVSPKVVIRVESHLPVIWQIFVRPVLERKNTLADEGQDQVIRLDLLGLHSFGDKLGDLDVIICGVRGFHRHMFL